jgi:hypothetical protein
MADDKKEKQAGRQALPTSATLELDRPRAELLLQVLRRFQLGGTAEQLRAVLPIYEQLVGDVARAALFLKQGIVIQDAPAGVGSPKDATIPTGPPDRGVKGAAR